MFSEIYFIPGQYCCMPSDSMWEYFAPESHTKCLHSICILKQFRYIVHTVSSATTVQIYHTYTLISSSCSDLSYTESGQHQQFRFIMHAVWSAASVRYIMHGVWSAATAQIHHAHSLISTNNSDLSFTQSGQHQQYRLFMHAVWSAPIIQIYHARSLISTNSSE